MPSLRLPERPTLPSLQSLGLPTPEMRRARYDSKDDFHDIPSVIMNDYFSQQPRRHRARQASTSSHASSIGSSSRSPSPASVISSSSTTSHLDIPSFSPFPSPPPPAISNHNSQDKFRFVPCTSLEDAEALIIIPPATTASEQCNSQALLITGSSLQHIRSNPARSIAKGARVHPYRILRSPHPVVSSYAGRRRSRHLLI